MITRAPGTESAPPRERGLKPSSTYEAPKSMARDMERPKAPLAEGGAVPGDAPSCSRQRSCRAGARRYIVLRTGMRMLRDARYELCGVVVAAIAVTSCPP